jgi:recombination protein RecT
MIQTKEHKTSIIEFIEMKKDEIMKILPKNLPIDKFQRIVINQFNKNPKLFECTQISVFDALMSAAELGLFPSSTTGQAYLIPYGNKCQYQTGYQGYIELANRTGLFQYINAETVYSNDIFEIELGGNPKLTHKPSLKDRGNIIGYYAIAFLKVGEFHPFKYMSLKEIEDRKPKKYDSSFWRDYPEQMAKKTVIKELLKTSFKTDNIERAFELDAESDSFSYDAKEINNQDINNKLEDI